MAAPERPPEAPIWTSPPPGGPPPRRRWGMALAAAAVAALAVGTWALLRHDTPAASAPEAPPAAAPADPPAVEGPPAEPAVDPRLAELRSSDRFVALAEHERAAAAVAAGEASFGWNNFGIVYDGEVVHEWTNKVELWNEVVPPVRDELLLLGTPYTEPMWDEERPSPASIGARWPDEATGGRGQYIEVTGRYFDEARGTPVELAWAVLIATLDDGSGEVVAHMAPVELVQSQATSFRHAREIIRTAAWGWVHRQAVLETGSP